jgi:hypothetical protein
VDPPTKGVPLRQLLRLQLDAAASGVAVHFCGNSHVRSHASCDVGLLSDWLLLDGMCLHQYCHGKPSINSAISTQQHASPGGQPAPCKPPSSIHAVLLLLQPLASIDDLTATGVLGVGRQVTAPPATEARAFEVGRHRRVTTQAKWQLPPFMDLVYGQVLQ